MVFWASSKARALLRRFGAQSTCCRHSSSRLRLQGFNSWDDIVNDQHVQGGSPKRELCHVARLAALTSLACLQVAPGRPRLLYNLFLTTADAVRLTPAYDADSPPNTSLQKLPEDLGLVSRNEAQLTRSPLSASSKPKMRSHPQVRSSRANESLPGTLGVAENAWPRNSFCLSICLSIYLYVAILQ